ncbi:helix-turn-helix domain-containing protein [Pseudomonas aeruginosa]|uniref:helix-turn-helix domain-containing protein n=1 Tax=Pseudomonas TaxID=286 RepID=UPI00041EA4C6|nr:MULTISPECIES: helix-turn-helix transcriptional regulator [Pseudomonas]MCS7665511.1 helix-turn-helix domain-containing protein [Pseudomonas aeruginosa]HDU9087706.1 helix-turn-helix transcriptional regulator [Pseudomonas aeruginosa]HEK2773010.1 helix-turn-helix transcriptional regulator [Pseudomonas aeruginosa]HEO1531383.1 helix-turn-helix transcriptional regulator [Pseudomonas aeruginosa]HEO1718192.1 helix-turn-helix transcriptional regulator [Pseudomonas aeruginosa]
MELNIAFGQALKKVRASKNLTQEDFSTVSSRTYLSSLERGLKSPTLEKINQLAGALKVHPLTILVATYIGRDDHQDVERLFQTIRDELAEVTSLEHLSQRS